MALTVQLPPDVAARLRAEAARRVPPELAASGAPEPGGA